jgi:hypothetical protein
MQLPSFGTQGIYDDLHREGRVCWSYVLWKGAMEAKPVSEGRRLPVSKLRYMQDERERKQV